MAADVEILFEEALSSITKGERVRAKDLLTRLLKTDSSNPQYWLWMSAVVDTSRERVYCLKETLRRDPQNEAARRGLILAGALRGERGQPPAPLYRRDWQSTLRGGADNLPRAQAGRIVLYAGGGLLLLALVAIGLFGQRIFKSRPAAALALRPPPIAATVTFLPTPSPWQHTPEPDSTGPAPLSSLLKATYTPTPLYVDTPHPRNESYRAAQRAYARGELPAAQNYFQQVLTVEPGAPDLNYYNGEMYRQQGNYDAAKDAYNLSLRLDAHFAPAYLGLALAQMGDTPGTGSEAENYLLEALRYDPDLGQATLELAALYLRREDARSALKVLSNAPASLQASPWFYIYRAEAELLDGSASLAAADARQANELDLTLLEPYRLLGNALQQTGDTEGSLKALQTYLLYKPADAEALGWLGKAFLAEKEPARALDAFTRAIAADPNQPEVYALRGQLYLEENKGQSALDDFNRVLVSQRDSFDANLGKGRALLLLGYNGDAYMQISRSEGFSRSNADKAQVYYWRAQSLELLKDKDPNSAIAAIHDWQALLALPQDSFPSGWAQTAQKHLIALNTATPTPKPTMTASPTQTLPPTRTPTLTRTPTPTLTSPGPTATPSVKP